MVFIPHWFWTPGHACSLFYDFHLLDFKCSDDSEDSEDDLASGWECWLSPIHFNSEVLQESTENLMIGKSMAEFLLHLWLLIEDNTYTHRHPKRGPYPKFPHLNFVNLSFVIGNQSANRAIINWSEGHIYIYIYISSLHFFVSILSNFVWMLSTPDGNRKLFCKAFIYNEKTNCHIYWTYDITLSNHHISLCCLPVFSRCVFHSFSL